MENLDPEETTARLLQRDFLILRIFAKPWTAGDT